MVDVWHMQDGRFIFSRIVIISMCYNTVCV